MVNYTCEKCGFENTDSLLCKKCLHIASQEIQQTISSARKNMSVEDFNRTEEERAKTLEEDTKKLKHKKFYLRLGRLSCLFLELLFFTWLNKDAVNSGPYFINYLISRFILYSNWGKARFIETEEKRFPLFLTGFFITLFITFAQVALTIILYAIFPNLLFPFG